ncbi:MAG: malonate transporter subunit MadM [Verrucomicrobia bacterium]|nr:malonate transporter subunit MadM [Verrucomicrobiota bacterium]
MTLVEAVFTKNNLLTAFALVGGLMLVSYWAAGTLTRDRLHGSAIAILLALVLAALAGGKNGLADLPVLSGLGLMGGAMLRDFAIVATAFGARLEEFIKSGFIGMLSLFTGLLVSFVAGGAVAVAFGYRDPVSITTLGAGAATYIVGPVTGTALHADSEVIALSIAAGLVKAIAVMIATPLLAKSIGLDNPRAAMIFGGLMGTNSGVMAGLAATDPKLVPYGAMTATFYTGLGCLLGPSLFFLIARFLF